jgi:hypothetical protein
MTTTKQVEMDNRTLDQSLQNISSVDDDPEKGQSAQGKDYAKPSSELLEAFLTLFDRGIESDRENNSNRTRFRCSLLPKMLVDQWGLLENIEEPTKIQGELKTKWKSDNFMTKKPQDRIKGISKSLQERFLKNELYRSVVNGDILNEEAVPSVEFTQIKSNRMTLSNMETKKNIVTLVDLKSYYGEKSTNHCIFGSEIHKQLISK